MSKHYLVTGSEGFVGRALVRSLLTAGHCVRGLDHKPLNRDVDLYESFMFGDIRDERIVRKAAHGVDGVIHLAYVNGTDKFYKQPEIVLDVATRGMLNVIDACIRSDVRELFLASSAEACQANVVPTSEAVPLVVPDPLNPRYSYGGGKIISELLALNYGRQHYFDRVVIFRPHNIYGPPNIYSSHVIPTYIRKIGEGLNRWSTSACSLIQVQGTGEETRSFCFIDDVIDGIMLLLEKGEHLGIYNIGTAEETTIAEVVEQIGDYFGCTIIVGPGPLQPGSVPRRCPDISKIAKLGFEPKVGLAEGLKRTVEWYKLTKLEGHT